MAKVAPISSNRTAKELAIVIYDFLLEERVKDTYSKKAKQRIDQAADNLEKVYRIKFTDYVMLKFLHPLKDIFAVGYHPVKVKNRIAAEVHKKKGNEFMDSKIFDLAEVEYTRAIQLDSGNAIYFCNRGASRIRQSAFPQALSDLNRSLALDKNYTKAYVWLGLAHALMDHPAKAVRCYRKALRIEPDNEACVANMVLINRKLNRITFRVLEPLYRYSRGLARMAVTVANKQIFAKMRNSDSVENEAKSLNLAKYTLETLD